MNFVHHSNLQTNLNFLFLFQFAHITYVEQDENPALFSIVHCHWHWMTLNIHRWLIVCYRTSGRCLCAMHGQKLPPQIFVFQLDPAYCALIVRQRPVHRVQYVCDCRLEDFIERRLQKEFQVRSPRHPPFAKVLRQSVTQLLGCRMCKILPRSLY